MDLHSQIISATIGGGADASYEMKGYVAGGVIEERSIGVGKIVLVLLSYYVIIMRTEAVPTLYKRSATTIVFLSLSAMATITSTSIVVYHHGIIHFVTCM